MFPAAALKQCFTTHSKKQLVGDLAKRHSKKEGYKKATFIPSGVRERIGDAV